MFHTGNCKITFSKSKNKISHLSLGFTRTVVTLSQHARSIANQSAAKSLYNSQQQLLAPRTPTTLSQSPNSTFGSDRPTKLYRHPDSHIPASHPLYYIFVAKINGLDQPCSGTVRKHCGSAYFDRVRLHHLCCPSYLLSG